MKGRRATGSEGSPGKSQVPDDVGVGDEFLVRWDDGPNGLAPLTIVAVTRVTAKLVHGRLQGSGGEWRFRRRDGLTTRRDSRARLCRRLYRRLPQEGDEGRTDALIADIGELLADRSARGLPMDRTSRLLERVRDCLAARRRGWPRPGESVKSDAGDAQGAEPREGRADVGQQLG